MQYTLPLLLLGLSIFKFAPPPSDLLRAARMKKLSSYSVRMTIPDWIKICQMALENDRENVFFPLRPPPFTLLSLYSKQKHPIQTEEAFE